jgi:predicted metal-dependent HD superfamily phosphohydrolase
MLKEIFEDLCSNYTNDKDLVLKLWQEIEFAYSKPKRHYHTLSHLENVYQHLQHVKDKIKNWKAILFALFYHDIIYIPTKSNNEEKSAELSAKRLQELGISNASIKITVQLILATKNHEPSTNEDINYFTDADLSILGESWDKYKEYQSNVRKDYRVYPDLIYKAGRRKVLERFISMPQIYKSDFFNNLFEQKAKDNLEKEKAFYL